MRVPARCVRATTGLAAYSPLSQWQIRVKSASVVHFEPAGSSIPRSAASQLIGNCASRAPRTRIAALENVSASFPAGTSTVILAAPGAGSSTLLRLVAGRVRATPASAVTWSGSDTLALKTAGVSIARLAAYCREGDEHEAHLTVRETLHFAHSTGVTPVPPSSGELGTAFYTVPSVEDIVSAMGLTAAGNTIAGGMLARCVPQQMKPPFSTTPPLHSESSPQWPIGRRATPAVGG